MRQLFFALLLLASLSTRAQSAWTLALPIDNLNGVMAVATDEPGNVYVTGRFTGSLQLGTTLLTSSRPGTTLYIAKCKPDGKVLQVTKLEGAADVLPRSIAVDKSGNSYVTGSFTGTLTYNGAEQITSRNGGGNILLLKAGSNGKVSWVRQADGGQSASGANCVGQAVAVDKAGNSYITGTVNGPNIRFETRTFGDHRFQGFVASYDRQGQLQWAKVFSAIAAGFVSSPGNGIAVDDEGSCYVSGNSVRGWSLDGTTLLSPNDTDYLARFDTGQGRLRWALPTPGTGGGQAIATDKQGDVYIGSSFSGTAVFGRTTLTSAGDVDGFVARYHPNGSVDWATALGGLNYDVVNALAVDQKTRRTYATGFQNFTSQNTNQSFLTRLGANGQLQSTELVSGPGTSSCSSLAIDDKENIYSAGVFTGSCSFGSISLTTAATKGYFGRFGSRIPGHRESAKGLDIAVFPNPAQSQFTLRITDQEVAVRATLYNPQGRAVATQALQPSDALVDAAFDTAALPDGLYVLRLEHARETTTRLVNVQH